MFVLTSPGVAPAGAAGTELQGADSCTSCTAPAGLATWIVSPRLSAIAAMDPAFTATCKESEPEEVEPEEAGTLPAPRLSQHLAKNAYVHTHVYTVYM